jgi:hypothetical protein
MAKDRTVSFVTFGAPFGSGRDAPAHFSRIPLHQVMTKAATAWGEAAVVEQLALPQRAGGKRFSSLVQLLENDKGEKLVRFAYSTDGKARRGPVTLRAVDLERLRQELAGSPGLAEVLRMEAEPKTA